MAVQKIITATLLGINAELVEVEADISNGLPATIIVGLPDTAVQESRERVRLAIKHSGFVYPQTRVSLNLAPGGLPKVGTHFDLPIALAILKAVSIIPANIDLSNSLVIGELSLDGTVKASVGILAMVQQARNSGIKSVFVPVENANMAALVNDVDVYPIESLLQLADHLSGKKKIQKHIKKFSFNENVRRGNFDFSQIYGQQHAKRALEIAAAGGHNVLMTGPPGSGKTMLAKALPSILPNLQPEEILELTKIYNSTSKHDKGIILQRPFRNPHHTTSQIALIGGGGVPRPGEVTLAHKGVLFLDELPEFSRTVLEVLRQPLEEGEITITRAKYAFKFPASFILVAAQNPCPCGNYGQSIENAKLQCDCHPTAVQKYKKKISGPLLDRIDLHINVPRLNYEEISGRDVSGDQSTESAESSARIRNRVQAARNIQEQRYQKPQTNSEMTARQLKEFCELNKQSHELLKKAADLYQLSGRTIHRIQKVARTIADLEAVENIEPKHIAESLQYRLRE